MSSFKMLSQQDGIPGLLVSTVQNRLYAYPILRLRNISCLLFTYIYVVPTTPLLSAAPLLSGPQKPRITRPQHCESEPASIEIGKSPDLSPQTDSKPCLYLSASRSTFLGDVLLGGAMELEGGSKRTSGRCSSAIVVGGSPNAGFTVGS